MDESDTYSDVKDTPEVYPLNAKCEENTFEKSTLPKYGLMYKLDRLKQDEKYRDQILFGCCIVLTFFVQGWTKGLIGPAFPDLLHITNTDLERGSAYFTSYYAGKIVGSGSGGYLFECCDINWLISLTYFLHAITIAAIPWCSIYEVMVAVFLCTGVLNSLIDVVVVTCSLRLFGPEGNIFVQITQLILSISSILSPLVTAPFLLPPNDSQTGAVIEMSFNMSNVTEQRTNVNVLYPNATTEKYSIVNETTLSKKQSMVYIPFTISASCILLTSILFSVLQLTGKNNIISKKANKKLTGVSEPSRLDKCKLVVCLINISFFCTISAAVEMSLCNLLSMFCMEHMGWTAKEGAVAISFFFLTYMFGRVIGIAMSKCIRPITSLGFGTVLCIVGFSVLLLSAYTYYSIGIWFGTAICGVSIAILFPGLLAWLNQTLFVSGRLTSIVMVTSYIGSMTNPSILSFFMEEFGSEWFTYISLIESSLLFITFIVMACTKLQSEAKDEEIAVD